MTRIKNKIPYKVKNILAGSDYFPMTNSEHNVDGMSYEQTVSADFDAVKAFVLAGMTPEVGGNLKIRKQILPTLITDISTTVNQMTPLYEIAPYEMLFFEISGHLYLLKNTNISVGVGGETLYNSDFIDFPVSVGATGNGIVSIVKTGTSGLVDTYTITYTDETTSTFTITNGANGSNGLNANMTRVSSDSLAIATSGSKTLTYTSSANLGWLNGTRLRYAYDGSNYMEGVVTSVSATSVTITVDNSKGSGTYTAWNIGIAGDKGSTGSLNSIATENSSSTLTITSQVHSDLDYVLNFQNSDLKVFVTGTVTNNKVSTYGATGILTILDSDFYAKTGIPTQFYGVKDNTTFDNVLIQFTTNQMNLLGDIETGKSIEINGFYYKN